MSLDLLLEYQPLHLIFDNDLIRVKKSLNLTHYFLKITIYMMYNIINIIYQSIIKVPISCIRGGGNHETF